MFPYAAFVAHLPTHAGFDRIDHHISANEDVRMGTVSEVRIYLTNGARSRRMKMAKQTPTS